MPGVTLVVVMVGGAESVAIIPPKLVAVPVATQLALPAHEAPSSEPTPAGAAAPLQEEPLSVVSRMDEPPTAVQLVELKQETADRVVGPAGVPRSVQFVPPSEVPMACEPTAMQSAVVAHEIPSSEFTPAGPVCGDHDVPPVVVAMMADPGPPDDEPTAMQSRMAAQAIPVKFVTVAGIDSVDQVVPPFDVPTMLGAPMVELKSLAA